MDGCGRDAKDACCVGSCTYRALGRVAQTVIIGYFADFRRLVENQCVTLRDCQIRRTLQSVDRQFRIQHKMYQF